MGIKYINTDEVLGRMPMREKASVVFFFFFFLQWVDMREKVLGEK